MPLVILAVGCAMAWWSSMTRTRDREEIGRAITQAMEDICADRSIALPTEPSAPLLRELLLDELRKVCSEVGSTGALEVHINVGDAPVSGLAAGGASHTAIIRMRDTGRVLLVLRVNRTDQNAMVIVGYSVGPGPAAGG